MEDERFCDWTEELDGFKRGDQLFKEWCQDHNKELSSENRKEYNWWLIKCGCK